MSVPNYLIIFTRYPEPGKAKTRLIPALGEAGAAALHRQMAEDTVAQAQRLQKDQSTLSLEVHFAGGDLAQMRHWLGEQGQYRSQGSGSLGDRLIQAFQGAFQQQATAVVVIGTDCPSLQADLLSLAFERLTTADLVLGEASDGGYYLIGLRQPTPELFQTISWSTDVVFQQTLAIARKLNLTTALLPVLDDIDRPEDLTTLKR
ncbi:DUF2064 domain-containing protein [Myxacorys almedinensis A]|uniref:DUF2064 domain-containing protein n=1 Tax=Myxacorys almedinensis A TaxID=2690445 RepID=A0A8J7Z321_9CYAN|nr:DUF2064 domain-containing protein [Myxacorys almedinensis A]